MSQVNSAARTAHAMIINRWRSHVGPTRWVFFDHIGEWGNNCLDRAALNGYIQYGNHAVAAMYYDAFTDHLGIPLDGSVSHSYQLTSAKDQIPQALLVADRVHPGRCDSVPEPGKQATSRRRSAPMASSDTSGRMIRDDLSVLTHNVLPRRNGVTTIR